MLANHPQLFMQMALPALSEMRVSASRHRLIRCREPDALMFLASDGDRALTVVNPAFVAWWVGMRIAGTAVTALLLAGMLARHINYDDDLRSFRSATNAVSLTGIADGLVVLATYGGGSVPHFGVHGAPPGLLLGTMLVSLPATVIALARGRTSP